MQPFDASIDLTVYSVPAGVLPCQAVAAVRRAVEGLPGAGWISVEFHGAAPGGLPWLTLFRRSCAVPPSTERFDGLASLVETTVREALNAEVVAACA